MEIQMKYILILIIGMMAYLASPSAHAFENENFYNEKYCTEMGGDYQSYYKATFTGATGASLDCETDDVAWEGEWATKSYEAVGQSLWYASITGKIPGIIFYIKKAKHQKYIDRAILTLDSLGIDYRIKIVNLF